MGWHGKGKLSRIFKETQAKAPMKLWTLQIFEFFETTDKFESTNNFDLQEFTISNIIAQLNNQVLLEALKRWI